MASESTQTTLRAELQAAQRRIAELERAGACAAHTTAAAHPECGVDSDSSERKVLEDALRRQSEQLAAVIEVEHALAATLDQELIYARLLQGIQRLFPDVTTFLISTYDKERALIRALAGIQDGKIVDVACLPDIPLAPVGQGTQSQVIRTRQPLRIGANLLEQFRPDTVVHIGASGSQDTQSALYVPMLAQGQVLGIVQLQSYSPYRFTEQDVQMLALVANAAAAAIENARLHEMAQKEIVERKQAEEVAQAQRDLAHIIGAVTSSQAAWPLCLALALRVAGMDSGGIYLFDDRQHTLELVHHQGLGADFIQRVTRYPAESPTAQMVLAGKTFLFTAAELAGQKHHRAEGLQSLASFPIVYQGRVIGCINLASHTLPQVPVYARNALEMLADEVGYVAIFLHTTEALRHSEERFRRLAENSPSLIYRYELSPQRGFSFVNAAATRMTGYSPEEHYADPDLGFKLVHPDDRPLLAAATTSGDAYPKPLVLRWLRKDGTILWTEQRNLPIYDAGGNIIALEGIANDISESKHAQIALQQSEEKYRGLLASLDSIVATVDSDGRFLYMNDPAASQLDGEAAELTGKTMYELFPEPVAASQMEKIHKAIDEDRAQVYETISMVQGEQRWYRTTIQPIHDEAGRVIYALINATDIHDLKTAQQELLELNYTLEERIKQRTAEMQDLYDNAPAGYHSLDTNGHVIMINQTELNWLGYTREEVIGRPITDFHTAASRQAFRAVYPTFIERGWVKDTEYEYVRKDGAILPVLVNATAIHDEDGNYVMSRTTVFDNTERIAVDKALRSANQELERTLRMKDEFLANMSHELRTPLTGILALSEIMLEQVYGQLNERQLKALRNIETSGRHLLALINDLLDLAKVDAGKFELNLEMAAVDEICQASLLFVREIALKKNIQIAYRCNHPFARIQVDPKRLKQMLVNLLSNAIKFTADYGQVQLAVIVQEEAQQIQFAVRDSGIGIAAADLPRLFQPFTQLDATLSRQYEGTGLGLALVKQLAQQHGGSVYAESAGVPGQGSCFTIILPYTNRQSAGTVVSAPVTSPAETLSGVSAVTSPLVLLAEDNEVNIDALCEYLEYLGYRFIVARTGPEALARAQAQPPDLILMDIQLPLMDGIEITRRLRRDTRLATTPIIAITALAMAGDRERCLQAGATAYLSKPVHLPELSALMARLL